MKQKNAWIEFMFYLFIYIYMAVLFFKEEMLFIYFWLHWVFVASCGLSLVPLHCRAWASHCGSCVFLWAQALGCLGFSNCCTRAQRLQLVGSSIGAQ